MASNQLAMASNMGGLGDCEGFAMFCSRRQDDQIRIIPAASECSDVNGNPRAAWGATGPSVGMGGWMV